MMWLSIGYLIRNLVRGAIHPTSEEAGILYPLTPFFIKEQIEMKSRNWTTIHYIIESYDDLNIIINSCGIDGNFKNELLNVWNNLQNTNQE